MCLPDSTPPRPRSRAVFTRYHLIFLACVAWLVAKQLLLMQLIGIRFDLRLLAAVLGATLVLAGPALWLRARRQAVALLGVDLVITLITYANVLYYRQFHDFVSVASLRFAGQLQAVRESVLTLLRPADLLFGVDLALLILLLPASRLPWQRWFARGPGWVTAAGMALGMAMACTITMLEPALTHTYSGHTALGTHLGLVNYQAVDAWRYAGRMMRRLAPRPSVAAEVEDWFEQTAVAPRAPSGLQGTAKGKNVMFLQVESLHDFVLGLKVNGQEVTPNLNKLRGEAIGFRNFFTQVGQGYTADAEFLANCSLYPASTGAVFVDYAANEFLCLPKLLRTAGYQSVVMHSDRPDFWNRATIYPKIGFDRFYTSGDYVQDGRIGLGLADRSFLRQSVAKLQALPQPFHAVVITLSSHAPYGSDPAIPHQLNLGALEGTTAGHYLHVIHYVDAAIGEFIAGLKETRLLDRTVLAVYGDHTVLKRSAQGLAELLQIPATDQPAWALVENRVPFLLRLPGGIQGERRHVAGEIDLAPTVAGLLGLPTDRTYFMGRNLLTQPDGITVLHGGSAISDRRMFLADVGLGTSGCYQMGTGQERPVAECSAEAGHAEQSLTISSRILDYNLRPNVEPARASWLPPERLRLGQGRRQAGSELGLPVHPCPVPRPAS